MRVRLRHRAIALITSLIMCVNAIAQDDSLRIGHDELIELTLEADGVSEALYERLMEASHDTLQEHFVMIQANSRMKNNATYVGDAWHETIRYRLTHQNDSHTTWKAGLVMDKDAGERWQKHAPWADSFSAYAMTERNNGWLRQAVVGHYRIRLASGLMCNQQFTLGKNVAGTMFMQRGRDLTAHSSASEDDHMLGAAARFRIGNNLEIMPFVSARPIDGTLSNDTLTSWSTGGMHRTKGELSRRHTAWMANAGTSLTWMGEWHRVTTSVLYSRFSHTMQRKLRTDNRNAFRGQGLLQASVGYELRLMGLHLKGETATDDHGGWATVNALQRRIGYDWMTTVIGRRYGNTYRQLLGSSVAETSAMQGETGLTLMTEGPLIRHLTLMVLADWFRFTKPQYGIAQPSDGYELITRITLRPRNRIVQQASISYGMKHKHKNNTLTADPKDVTPYFRHTMNGLLTLQATRSLTLKSQLRTRMYSAMNTGGIQAGWMISQAATWQTGSIRIDAQATHYSTDNYDTRVYLSEHNQQYVFSTPMLYGKGQRYAFGLSYKPTWYLSVEAKYAYDTRRKSELWVQGRWRIRN